jgi:hypothetical protein
MASNYGTNFQTVEDCVDDIKRNYRTPGHPIAFSGIQSLYNYYKGILTIEKIQEVLSEIEAYTLHREYHSSQRNPSYSHFKRYQFQMDLVDVQSLAEFNSGLKYLLTCIDTFTRYAFVRPLRTKEASEVIKAFHSILSEAKVPPKTLVVDRGTEFNNQHFKEYCQTFNIKVFLPDSSIHAAFVERFNRTLQSLIYKYMTENETNRYISSTDKAGNRIYVLPKLVETYNRRKHRMTGVTPFEAENNPQVHLSMRLKMSKYYESVKRKPVKFKIGDQVRIARQKGKFSRGYNETSSAEIFKIYQIKKMDRIPMYVISNFRGDEIIKGAFYSFELTKVGGDVYRVEKVIKTRKRNGKTEQYVKWKGFDDTYNSWIESDNVVQDFQNE